jgi:predicted CopG family antitoxin
MKWKLKTTKEKVKCSYKTLYIADSVIEKIDKIAKENNTSFNNVIISMIESCLKEKNSKA